MKTIWIPRQTFQRNAEWTMISKANYNSRQINWDCASYNLYGRPPSPLALNLGQLIWRALYIWVNVSVCSPFSVLTKIWLTRPYNKGKPNIQRSLRARLARAVGVLISSSSRRFVGWCGLCNWLCAVSCNCKAWVFSRSASKSGFNAAILWLCNATVGRLLTAAVNCSLTVNSVVSELLFHWSLSSSLVSLLMSPSFSGSGFSSRSRLQMMLTWARTSASNLDIVLTSGFAQPMCKIGVWLPSSHLQMPS